MELAAPKMAKALLRVEFKPYCNRTNVETKVLKTCFSPDELWFVEKIEERYGL